jgi:hypothetical protein
MGIKEVLNTELTFRQRPRIFVDPEIIKIARSYLRHLHKGKKMQIFEFQTVTKEEVIVADDADLNKTANVLIDDYLRARPDIKRMFTKVEPLNAVNGTKLDALPVAERIVMHPALSNIEMVIARQQKHLIYLVGFNRRQGYPLFSFDPRLARIYVGAMLEVTRKRVEPPPVILIPADPPKIGHRENYGQRHEF